MGISVWQLLIVLLIVALLFGTKRLRTVGSDLGGAIRSFRRAASEEERPFQSEVVRMNKRERG
ncbi:MAG: twin-arginine translocase TatA/TatE family subunit [Halomonas sp.]|nr:twin-arginine translocase TatA/TatE family subunit [Halomonas sp.]